MGVSMIENNSSNKVYTIWHKIVMALLLSTTCFSLIGYSFNGYKVSALSNPNDYTEPRKVSIFNGATISSYVLPSNVSIMDLNYRNYGNETHINKYAVADIFNKNDKSLVTMFDGIVNSNSNILSNRYYDDGSGLPYLEQQTGAEGRHFIASYRNGGLTIEHDKPQLFYYDMQSLTNIEAWYILPKVYLGENELTKNFTLGVNADKSALNYVDGLGYELPSRLSLSLRFHYYNVDGELVSEGVNDITTDNALSGNYYDHDSANLLSKSVELKAILDKIPKSNNVISLERLTLTASVFVASVVYNPTTNAFTYHYSDTGFATIYLKSNYYNADYYAVLESIDNARYLITENSYTDNNLLANFFNGFWDFTIAPNLSLGMLASFAFGIILIIIFVRLFR